MRRTRFDTSPCPIARVTDLLGDWWTPLILREAFLGARRFEEFQTRLAIPRAVLAARLERLVAEDIMVQREYEQRPQRFEYRLTPKGAAAWDVLAAMWRYGSDWFWPKTKRPSLYLSDTETGNEIIPQVIDKNTGTPLDLHTTRVASRKRTP